MNAAASGLIFVCGFPSSGTDLLRSLLNAHREVHIAGEFPLLPALARRYGAQLEPQSIDSAVRDLVASDTYSNLAQREWPAERPRPGSFAELYAGMVAPRHTTWCGNKTPQNAENVDRLNVLFPDARYVLIVRDIRDVALSWRAKWGKDPLLCAHRWNERMTVAVESLRSLAPRRHRIVRYEDLLSDHADIARELCRFLELQFDDRMLEFHEHVGDAIPGNINYGQAIVAGNVGRWRSKLARGLVSRIEEIAAERMRDFGYVPEFATAARPLSRIGRASGVCRDMFAMLTVGNRALGSQSIRQRRDAIAHEFAKRFGRFATRR